MVIELAVLGGIIIIVVMIYFFKAYGSKNQSNTTPTDDARLWMDKSSDDASVKETLFQTYAPREAMATQEHFLFVYALATSSKADVQSDIKSLTQALQTDYAHAQEAANSAFLAAGTPITVIPECDQLTFSPPYLTQSLATPFTRFDFAFTPPTNLIGDIVLGRISVQVHGIEITHIPFATEINQATNGANPLAQAKFSQSKIHSPYQKIFVSYSRKDKDIAEHYRLAQIALGNDVFIDTYSIRTGENWQAALAHAIDNADIFQLFWSKNSAKSENVKDEWEYALQYRCPEDGCAGFIRPVYWDNPMPHPPAELRHINFRYVPLEA